MSYQDEFGKVLKRTFDGIMSGLPTLDELEEKAKHTKPTTITHRCKPQEQASNEWTGVSISKERGTKNWTLRVWHDEGGEETSIIFCPYCGRKLKK